MSKLTYRISYYALYAMFAVILIVLGLFYLGGDAQGADVVVGVDPEMWQPAHTNTLLILIYVLFGLAVANKDGGEHVHLLLYSNLAQL